MNVDDDEQVLATDRYYHIYIRIGDVAGVKRCLSQGASASHFQRKQLGTPLSEAIIAMQTEVVKVLLDHGCDVNKCPADEQSPLCMSIRFNLKEIALQLIQHPNIDVNWVDLVTQQQALHLAAKSGTLSIVQELINHGCQINCLDYEKATPLHLALFQKHLSVSCELVQAGADLHIPCYPSHTSVNLALCKATLSFALRQHDRRLTDLWPGSLRCATAVHLAAALGQTEVLQTMFDICPGLLQLTKDPLSNLTPLCLAVLFNEIAATELLIRLGYVANNALYLACNSNNTKMVEFLLKHGAKPLDSSGCVTHAALEGNLHMLTALLKHGANINEIDCDGSTALERSLYYNQNQIIEYLLMEGVAIGLNFSLSNALCEVGNTDKPTEYAQRLLSLGCDTDGPNIRGLTPLFCATELHCYPLVLLLLQAGCNVEAAKSKNNDPLFLAVRDHWLHGLVLLLQYGVDPWAHDIIQIAIYMAPKCASILLAVHTNVQIHHLMATNNIPQSDLKLKEVSNMVKDVKEKFCQVMTLKHWSRYNIRKTIKSCWKSLVKMDDLVYPKSLKEYLWMVELKELVAEDQILLP